jgi:hypothetical protein
MSTDNIIYSHEYLNEDDPISPQPDKIITLLKPHQLTSLFKATLMEQQEYIKYKINGESNIFKVHTNIGLLGDIVGYGKTLTALGIIANSPINNLNINNEYIKTYSDKNHNSMIIKSIFNNLPIKNTYIHSTLVIVPRGPVYLQWEKALKTQTKLKYLAIDNLRNIKQIPNINENDEKTVINYFNNYEVILIKNTNVKQLFEYCYNSERNFIKKWYRIMIDEFHDIAKTLPKIEYLFLWIITGTYNLIQYRSINNMTHIKEIIINELSHILVKGEPSYVKKSFKIPESIEKTYICKFPSTLTAIKSFLNQNVMERLNASDISGAVREMGGKTATIECMIEILTTNIKKDIYNKNCEINLIKILQINEEEKKIKIEHTEEQLKKLENQHKELCFRLSNIETRICPICIDIVEKPIVLECTHIYCCLCLVNWIKKSQYKQLNCPECRVKINNNKLISINSESENNLIVDIIKIETKENTLINIISSKINGKFLIFTKLDNCFSGVKNILEDNDISYAEIKGTTSCMRNILEKFKNNEIRVILLNTIYAGSGIDISFATDIILYHNLGKEKTVQAIARAQRYGRTESLNIHHLLYEHEKII